RERSGPAQCVSTFSPPNGRPPASVVVSLACFLALWIAVDCPSETASTWWNRPRTRRHEYDRTSSLFARSLGSQRRALRGHPHHAVQCRARGRIAERGALQALHYPGRALSHRLRPRAHARCREGAGGGSNRAIREIGRG